MSLNRRHRIRLWPFFWLILLGPLMHPVELRSQTKYFDKPSSPFSADPEQEAERAQTSCSCTVANPFLALNPPHPPADCGLPAVPSLSLTGNSAALNRWGKRGIDRQHFIAPDGRPLRYPAAQPRTTDDRSIEWGGLLVDSTRFLLFQQAFRLATESDTRAGLSGPFFRDYKDAVLNIHGWNDGDPFFVNYIDHPMEGSVAGFLEVAHDSRYRNVEFGKSSGYWKSRLRAMAFSAAFSLQFEIGPVSEASIGNIQKINSKAGVVDWVITPVVGMGWMVGEDVLDKYVVRRLEARTNNHFTRILLRGVLNPTRSFANLMQGRVPWHRDTREGVRDF